MNKIIFISDQFFPRTSADSEQIISSLLALGKYAEVQLISAHYKSNKPVSKNELEAYYQDFITFELKFIPHLFKNIRGFEKLSFAIRSAFRLKKMKPDLVYTRNIPVLISVLLFTNFPIVFESYRPWPKRNFLAKYFFTKLKKKKRFLGIILHSNFAGESFKDVGFSTGQLLIAHNAVNLDKYDEVDVKETLKSYNLPDDKLIVTYTGRVSVEKGLLRVYDLAEAFPDILFLIVGSEKQGIIERRAKKYENIEILPWLDKKSVFNLLVSSDILYIPNSLQAREQSLNTVLPLKTFIYKASGTTILAPNIEDVAEVLTDMETAVLVEPDNIEKEIEGFKLLIENKNLREKIGNAAKNEMKELTWEKRAHKILTFINERSKVLN